MASDVKSKAIVLVYVAVGSILVVAGLLTWEVGIGFLLIPLGAGMVYYGLKESGLKGVPA